MIFGRPERRRERKCQYQRKRARCQPKTVPGFTTPAHSPILTTNAQADPEQAIPWTQQGLGLVTLEDADLLPQGDELQSEVMSRAEEGTEPREKGQKKPDHGASLHDAFDGKAGFLQAADFASNPDFEDRQPNYIQRKRWKDQRLTPSPLILAPPGVSSVFVK